MRRFSIADFPCPPLQRDRRGFWIGVPVVFILVLTLALLATPLCPEVQRPFKVPREGALGEACAVRGV